ncbi:MAG: hypothetical protein C5B51_32710, partial [Terriglobia bacterium]
MTAKDGFQIAHDPALEDDLPEGWVVAPLGDVATLQRGFDLPEHQRQPGNVTVWAANGPVGKHNIARVDGPGVITGRSGTIGKVHFTERDFWPLNTALYVKDFHGSDPKFIALLLRNFGLEKYHAGTGVPTLNRNVVHEMPVAVPPLAEQVRIVAKVESLDSCLVSANNHLAKARKNLTTFRQSVLAMACSGSLTEDWRQQNANIPDASDIIAALQNHRERDAKSAAEREKIRKAYEECEEGDSGDLPDSWAWCSLRKLCASFDYGTSSKSNPTGKVPVLRMGNVQNGEIDWGNLVFTSDSDEIRRYALKPNTVLFNRTNSPELVGKTAIYRGERPAIFAGYLIRIANLPELHSEYLNICLNAPRAREFCATTKTDGVSQSNINAQKLGSFEVPFCSLEEQLEIVRRAGALLAFASEVERGVKAATIRAEFLTRSILAKAFRGELVPTEAELARKERRGYEP